MSELTLYLAPMHGITDVTFRKTYFEFFHGVDCLFAPFITANPNKKVSAKLVRDVLPEANAGLPTVPQIMGNSGRAFVNLAKYLFDLGYNEVNWNLGCPYPMVAKKCRGSGLLPFPERIEALLETIVARIPNRLSVKTRLGRFEASEIHALVPVFNRFPLSEIIIHPRTGIQMYNGEVHLDIFAECLADLIPPVVYNGDITTLAGYQYLDQKFPLIDRWMIGRGVLMDPFLPWEIKHGRRLVTGRRETLKKFHDALVRRYQRKMSGPRHLIDRMKGIWRYLAHSFGDDPHLFKKIRKTKNLSGYWRVVDQVFADVEAHPADGSVGE